MGKQKPRSIENSCPQKKKPNKNYRTVLKFIISYIFLMGMFFLLIGLEPVKRVVDIDGVYSNMVVFLTALILSPFNVVQGTDGSAIRLYQGMVLDVKFGCNGLEAFLIYAIAILSFPADKWKKLIGVGVGFIGLQTLNVLRIAGLAFCGIYFQQLFHYVHIYIAQGIMIAIAVLFFLIWLNYAAKQETPV